MKLLITQLLGALLAMLVATVAAQAQATIADCEKIQAADAYNQCLAKFGPPAKIGNLEPERPGDIKTSSADAAASGGQAMRARGHGAWRRRAFHRGAVRQVRGGHGRRRMTIIVGK